MAGICLVIVIILLQGTIEGGNIGRCFDILINMRTAETDQCSAVNEFITCLIQELNLLATRPSQSEITNLENIVKENLADLGLRCRIDFRALIRRILVDQENGVTYVTRQPTGFVDAKTKGDCINALIISNTAADTVDCSLVSPFVKCIIRVTDYYKNIYTRMDEFSLLSDAQTQLNQLGLYCTVDISLLSAEVARDIATNAPTRSTIPVASNTIFTTSKTVSAISQHLPATATTISTTLITTPAVPTTISTTSIAISTTPKTISATPKAIPATPNTISTTPLAMSKVESTTPFTTTPGVDTEATRSCYSYFSHLYSMGANQCWSVEEFIKCLLAELHLLKSNVSERGMEDFGALVRSHIRLTGVQCNNYNISSIIRTIPEEESIGAAQPTVKPIGIDQAETKEQCLIAITDLTQDNRINCTLATLYTKCVIRVTNYYKYPHQTSGPDPLTVDIPAQLGLAGNQCAFDMHALSKEVGRKISSEVNTTKAAPSMSETGVLCGDSTTLASCWQAYYPIDFRTVVSPCTELSLYLKCLMRVTGPDKFKQDKLQTIANQEIRLQGWPCSVNVSSLGEEVEQEQVVNRSVVTGLDISLVLSMLIIIYIPSGLSF